MNWYHNAQQWHNQEEQKLEQERLKEEKKKEQEKERLQEAERIQLVQDYHQLKNIADSLGITRKLRDVASVVRGTTQVLETPTPQEGTRSGSSELLIQIVDTVHVLEVAFDNGSGRPAQYSQGGYSQGTGQPIGGKLIRGASWNYRPPKPIYLKRVSENIDYWVKLIIHTGVVYIQITQSLNNILSNVTLNEIDFALTQLVDQIKSHREIKERKFREKRAEYPSLPIR